MLKRLTLIAVIIALCSTPLAWAEELAQAVATKREMVVTANPLATEAGEKILKNGGTAVDAMIAVQTVLGLVEPQSSGIGGGAFVVYYDAENDRLTTIDAREKAPAAATEERFLDKDGKRLPFNDAWQSGLSVGVPGVPRMMEYMHDRYGRLPWQRLFVPAKVLAQRGYALTQRTSDQVAQLLGFNDADPRYSCENRLFLRDPTAFAYFAEPDCTAKPAGTWVRNKEYADTLKRIARRGADAFYTGPIAVDIIAAVQGDLNPSGDGDMTLQDLADYDVVERDPVCILYREEHNVCGMGPPSSGALAVGQILGILENFSFDSLAPLDVQTVHLVAEAGRLAFADRNLYVADPDFVTVPAEGMLDKGYLEDRADLIDPYFDMGTALPGIPPGEFDPNAPQPAAKESGTSHVSIVDRWGNALSMTTTVESFFGNGVMVRGFLLNNQLTDFSFAPTDASGNPIANRVQPNKRPRSSMSPTIILDDEGDVAFLTGSPGGSRIIGYTSQSIINVLDFGLDPQEAINVPHFLNRNGNTEVEPPKPGVTLDFDFDNLVAELKHRGHPVVPSGGETSGLSVIQVTDDGFLGGADTRREGTVGGR